MRYLSFCDWLIVAQLVKNLPAMWKTWVQSLGWEDALEKGKATHPLQYSGLENSMDCIVHEVTKSWTQLSDFHLFYEPQGSSVLYYVTGFPSIFRLNNIPWYMHCILLICSFICRWTFGSLLFLGCFE